MFENLSDRLGTIYKKLKGRGILKDADVDEALREIRIAMIEADVSLSAIKPFLKDVREKGVGQEVLKSLTPGHQMVKIINDELVSLLGGEFKELELAPSLPTVVLMAGLQGAGKTTTAGKLAKRFKDKGKNCLLVPADVYRPAAIKQLNLIGRDLEVEVYQAGGETNPVKICQNAVEAASGKMIHVVILDTAGRLQVDEELMAELKTIKEKVQPHQSLFVVDAMMGQHAA
ncbi:MAG TPA: signal recognition particle protein, partial [Nitrospina sp.]|nr:signal recognition particle protein [Nitrospina sp.]